jgi:hypothetical protein
MKKIKIETIWKFPAKLLSVMVTCLLLLCNSSCSGENKHQEYRDRGLGISIRVPTEWHIEKSERAQILELFPSETEGKETHGSITILRVVDDGEDILVSLNTEVDRVRQISSPKQIVITQEAEKYEVENYEAVYTELLIVSQEVDSQADSFEQPMELILIRGPNQSLIVLQVRKSHANEALNVQIDEIISSIKLTN